MRTLAAATGALPIAACNVRLPAIAVPVLVAGDEANASASHTQPIPNRPTSRPATSRR